LILYQDTSSIVKLYVEDEKGISETRKAVDEADFLATSLVAYAEVRAAFARARRENRLSDSEYDRILAAFHRDWRHYRKLNPSSTLIRKAGDLAERRALRGYDAIHLASALTLRDLVPVSMSLSTWDGRMATAATAEGLSLAHEVKQ